MEALIAFAVVALILYSDISDDKHSRSDEDDLSIGRSENGSYYVYRRSNGQVIYRAEKKRDCERFIYERF